MIGLKDKIQWSTEPDAETIRNMRHLTNRNKHKLNPDINDETIQAKQVIMQMFPEQVPNRTLKIIGLDK